MAALAATNSAIPSLQATLTMTRLQVARREANQAESSVRQLRADLEVAQNKSDQRQTNVRRLTDQSRQSDPTYSRQIQAKAADVPIQAQAIVLGLYHATNARQAVDGNGLPSVPAAAPVINTQGQATGRIVNISA